MAYDDLRSALWPSSVAGTNTTFTLKQHGDPPPATAIEIDSGVV